jgi:hypothetical protein
MLEDEWAVVVVEMLVQTQTWSCTRLCPCRRSLPPSARRVKG